MLSESHGPMAYGAISAGSLKGTNMAEKKAIASTLAAGAVARVKEQGATSWGVDEHLAFLRYMAVDAYKSAASMSAKNPAVKVEDNFNTLLKDAYAKDPEIAYASNFQKLLVKAGELKAGGGYA